MSLPSYCRRLPLTMLLSMLALASAAAGCERPAVSEQQDETALVPPDPPDSEAAEETNVSENTPDAGDADEPKIADEPKVDGGPQNPFNNRTPAPEFPKDMTWLNTGGPLEMRDLKGKFVLLDFWTFCCINCMHILPELKKLEEAYPNELVVIGVHSAKFDNEKDSQNIADAVLRYEIVHPVVNDSEHRIWNSYQVQSWPSLRLVDPEGNWVAEHSGEITFEQLDAFLKQVLPYYRQKRLLDETPLRFDLLAHQQPATPLRYPGKVLADEAGNRLFIADSNHNRIVITTLAGKLLETIGSGTSGRGDGNFATAAFNHPQGMALDGQTLYVADTENHLLRKIDLAKKQVTTIAGTGDQARSPWPGLERLDRFDAPPKRWVGPTAKTALNSPWALWVHERDLYIAMAGPHQIWKMPLDESEIGPYAGNGREDIVDGPLLPDQPYDVGFASFAQPSGLTSDGQWLYVADSEGSSIRAVPFDASQKVRTIVGTAKLPYARLFTFGDVDGRGLATIARTADGGIARDETGEPRIEGVRLQHALGVTYHDGRIFVADTYNNKLKVVDAKTGETRTLAGTGEPGHDDATATFDEPAGLSFASGKLYVADTNNHLIRTVDVASGQVNTLQIAGLAAPAPPKAVKKPTFSGATQVPIAASTVKALDGAVHLTVELELPKGWKINSLAPMGYLLEAVGNSGPVDRSKLVEKLTKLENPVAKFDISVPVTSGGQDTIRVSLNYFYCADESGICKVGSVVFTVPVTVRDDAAQDAVGLRYKVPD